MSAALKLLCPLLQALILAGVSLSMVLAPGRHWERARARRRRRDPGGNHDGGPSTDALNRYRLIGVISLLVLVPASIAFSRMLGTMAFGASSAHSAAVDTLADLKSDYHDVGSPSARQVGHAVRYANPFTRFREVGSDRYEISNLLGRGTVCLVITADLTASGTEIDGGVVDRPCLSHPDR
jgi:hypothetical protein